MTTLTLHARPRTVVGKKVKALRRRGLLPANVYGHNVPSQALELDAHAFYLLQRRMPANAVLDLVVEGKPARKVMIHRTQRNVRTGQPSHLELFQINPHERFTSPVQLVLVGEPELVRRGEAMLLQELHRVEVTCLLSELPSAIEVPVDGLTAIGSAIYVRDLVYDRERVEIKANPDDLVASLAAPQRVVAEEPAAAPAAPAAPAAEGGAPATE